MPGGTPQPCTRPAHARCERIAPPTEILESPALSFRLGHLGRNGQRLLQLGWQVGRVGALLRWPHVLWAPHGINTAVPTARPRGTGQRHLHTACPHAGVQLC